MSSRHPVIMLPGSLLPAELAYADLIASLGNHADAHAKELEIYATDAPPADYSLAAEVDGLVRFADQLRFDRTHLVGYSAGGASCLAFACEHPQRVLSLTLNEPAWAGRAGISAAEAAVWRRLEEISELPDQELMPAFVAVQLAPGVPLPPPPGAGGPPQPWLAKRPAGVRRFLDLFGHDDLDVERLRQVRAPVLFTLGGRSNPDFFGEIAVRLDRFLPDFTVERYEERHHFDPPHRAEPERMARSLTALWDRADPHLA
jgi:pimeloyl-ACP methyl ester carboxylesterase